MRSKIHSFKSAFATALVVGLMTHSAVAGQPSLATWQTPMNSFKKVGEWIGSEKYDRAQTELSSDSTNFSAPYSGMATEYLGKLDTALKISGPKDPKRLDKLVDLCTDLRACDAALRLQSRGKKEADDDDLASAWRLWQSGDTKATMAEYKRKLDAEPVEMWREYWEEQIRLLDEIRTNQNSVPVTVEFVQQHLLKAFEAKADVFSALEELTRVLPHARSPGESLLVHQLIIRNLDSMGDEVGRTAWEDKVLSDFKTNAEACARVHVDRGIRAYDKKDLATATTLFRKICSDYPDTQAYGDAQYTIALILQQQQKYDDAIAEYTKLFPSKVDDYVLPTDGNNGDYKCYRFRAALGISGCYDAKGDFAHALEYVEMARDRYKYLSWCKTCMADMKQNVDIRIVQLEQKVKQIK
jgi:tetratricopeptide (TPR) repeat protein